MIEKIEIKNTATYIDETLDNLSKVNFIYGNNGSGKTTISRIINFETLYPNCKIYWKSNRHLDTVVYNTDFITENFDQTDDIKGIFTLGKEEADTQKKIKTELSSRVTSISKEVLNYTNEIVGFSHKILLGNGYTFITIIMFIIPITIIICISIYIIIKRGEKYDF